MLTYVAQDPDMEYLLDSTMVRAHPCALGALKNGGQTEQALGRSQGGFSTKIHVSTDGLGNPLRFTLTSGQRHDITQAADLFRVFDCEFVIADRSYDAAAFLQLIAEQEATPVIPLRKNRTQPHDYDEHLYKEHRLIECFIGKIKHYRRIFFREARSMLSRLPELHWHAHLVTLKYQHNLVKSTLIPSWKRPCGP